MRRLVLLAMIALVVVLGPSPDPAGACTCAEVTPEESAAQADVVLVGVVVDAEPAEDPEWIGDAVRHTVEVERVYAGEAEAELVVYGGASSSGACEYAFDDGRYLIFATTDPGGGLHTSLCSGTRALPDGEPVPAELGRGVEPAALPPTTSGHPPIGGPDGDVVDPTWSDRLLPEVAVAGVAVALALGGGAVLLARRRAR